MKLVPNMAPLSRMSWFEWHEHGGRCGVFCGTVQDSNDPNEVKQIHTFPMPNGVRWLVSAQFFAGTGLDIWTVDFTVLLGIDHEGALITTSTLCLPDTPPTTDAEFGDHAGRILIALLAICFAHCKGVKQTEIRPSRQVMRQAQRDKKPIITYKVLEIDPARKILETEGQIGTTGIKRALHICRGHFAHYTDDKPLFGKYTGTYYVPMHTRGSLKAGAVVKDYEVKAP